MRNSIGVVGIILALVAISIALFQDDLRLLIDQRKPGGKLEAMRSGIALFTGEAKEEENDKIDYAYMLIGFVSFVLGVISFLKKENSRVSSASAALGIVAIAWHYVLFGVVVAVVIFLLANMS